MHNILTRPNNKWSLYESLFSLIYLQTTLCLLLKKLKKTKIINKTYWIDDSTYTVSYTDRCTSCNMSIDRPSGATLDNWKGAGGIYQKTDILHPKIGKGGGKKKRRNDLGGKLISMTFPLPCLNFNTSFWSSENKLFWLLKYP